MRVRAADADRGARLDEVDRVSPMLLDPRRDGEDVGVEDDVLGREPVCGQQVVRATADLDLAFLGISLPDLVERHHDAGRAVTSNLFGDF